MSHSFRQEPDLTYEQAKQALYRALELQAEQDSLPEVSDRVNRDQLAQMAAELGIKPEFANQATDELLRDLAKPPAWEFDTNKGFEHWIERPIQEEDWMQLGRRIQPILGNMGKWDEEAQSARWHGPHVLNLSVKTLGQRSQAKLEVDPTVEIGLALGVILSTVFMLFELVTLAYNGHDLAILGGVGQFLICLVAARWFKLRANRQRKQIFKQLTEVLAEYFA